MTPPPKPPLRAIEGGAPRDTRQPWERTWLGSIPWLESVRRYRRERGPDGEDPRDEARGWRTAALIATALATAAVVGAAILSRPRAPAPPAPPVIVVSAPPVLAGSAPSVPLLVPSGVVAKGEAMPARSAGPAPKRVAVVPETSSPMAPPAAPSTGQGRPF